MTILGKPGTGKSSRAKRLASGWIASGQVVIVWDPHGEWGQVSERPRVDSGPCLQVVPVDQLHRIVRLDGGIAVRPARGAEERELADGLRVLVRWLESLDERIDKVLIVDEVSLATEHYAPIIRRLVTQSRHVGCALVLIAQYAVAIPLSARRLQTWLVVGRQDDPEDVAALARYDERFPDELRELGQFECVVWREGVGIT